MRSIHLYLLAVILPIASPVPILVDIDLNTVDLPSLINDNAGEITIDLGEDQPKKYKIATPPTHRNGTKNGHYALLSAYHKYSQFVKNITMPPCLAAVAHQNETEILKCDRELAEHAINKRVTVGADTGTLAASPVNDNTEYLATISVGGQNMLMDFDTGSSDLWVVSNGLSAAAKATHMKVGGHVYTPPSTAKLLTGETFSITYADDSTASGKVYLDTVTVGGITVSNQAVEAATTLSTGFINGVRDGIVGLGLSDNNQASPVQQTTFIENVMPQLKQQVFTADLRRNNPGSYEFGFIDTSKYTGSITYANLVATSGWWQFDASGGIQVNGKTNADPTGSPNGAVADTGTTLLLLPKAVTDIYYKSVSGATYSTRTGGYTFPCSAKMPSLGLSVGSGFATIPSSLMIYGKANAAGTVCFGSLQTLSGSGLPNIYGDPFFQAAFSVFDYGNKRFGFAPKSS